MANISFYQLKAANLNTALLRLLEKTVAAGKRAVVRLADTAQAEAVDTALWTADPGSFLAHATEGAKNAALQPVLIIAGHDNPNKAEFAFVLPGAPGDDVDFYERVFFLFDGDSESELAEARGRFKTLLEAGLKPDFWIQDQRGKWTRKA